MIRNDEGEVLGALFEKIAMPRLVVTREMLATRRAVHFALEIGITHLVFEGDSEIIDKALSTDVTPLSSFGHMVKDTKSIASSLVNFSFSHTRRQGKFLLMP